MQQGPVSGNIAVQITTVDSGGIGAGGAPLPPGAGGRPAGAAGGANLGGAIQTLAKGAGPNGSSILTGFAAMGKFLPILGGALGILALVKYSKIANEMMSTLTQILGALVDVILAPFIPLLVPVLQALAKLVSGVAHFLRDPAAFFRDLSEHAKNAWEGIKNIASAYWSVITTIALGVWDVIKAAGSGIWKIIQDIVTGKWGDIISDVKKLWENVIKEVKNGWNEAITSIKNLIDALLPGKQFAPPGPATAIPSPATSIDPIIGRSKNLVEYLADLIWPYGGQRVAKSGDISITNNINVQGTTSSTVEEIRAGTRAATGQMIEELDEQRDGY